MTLPDGILPFRIHPWCEFQNSKLYSMIKKSTINVYIIHESETPIHFQNWVHVIADIAHYVFTVFGYPSYFTDENNILNDSILYSFIAELSKI